jgi:hypothetical protein
MRVIRVATWIVCSFIIAHLAYAASGPVLVNLGVPDPATPRTYAVDPGSFDIRLTNAIPNKKYEIVGEGVEAEAKVEVVTAAAAEACEATPAQVARILAKILAELKAKAPADKQADVKVTEADIAKELKGNLGCIATQADVDAAQKTLDAENAKPTPDATKVKAAQDDLKAKKAQVDTLPKLRDMFALKIGTFTLEKGALPKTFKAKGEDLTWPVVVTTQGGSAAVTAQAAAKAASPIASDSPVLDRLLATTRDQPQNVVGTCDYSAITDCTARIFINADQISTLTITHIPAGKVTVRVTGGEYFPCKAVEYNIASYESAPATLMVPMHMKKGFIGLGNRTVADAEAEAAAVYGIDWCPETDRSLKKKRMFGRESANSDYGIRVKDRENARRKNRNLDPKSDLRDLPDPRVELAKSPPIASLPLFLRGLSQEILIEFDWEGAPSKTFSIPVVYQRFWLDAGGFFVFTRRTDQSIVTSTVLNPDNTPSTPERQKVLAINRQTSFEPSTGIVINVHQGDFPILAYQFGISANQSRLPSYYLGIGIRAREIGKRGLATIGIGAAMQQETRFPLLENGSEIPSTDDRLKPVNKYGVTFPYISLSLGFSFGGVSEKTNVADSVQP